MNLFDLAGKKERVKELEKLQLEPGFWDDAEKSQKVIGEMNSYKNKISKYDKITSLIEDAEALIALMEEEEDFSFYDNLKEDIEKIEELSAEYKIETLLNSEYDNSNAILAIHAGTGGTEAQDWASMLYRMYTRYADKKGY